MVTKRRYWDGWVVIDMGHEVLPLAPWDPRRQWLNLDEAMLWMRRMYGIAVGTSLIEEWIRVGRTAPSGKRIYLNCQVLDGAGYGGKDVLLISKRDMAAYLGLGEDREEAGAP